MFGNNTKKETGKAKNTNFIASSPSNSLNSLVLGTVIEGTVRSESDIRVDGLIKGQLFCDAKVIIGPSGSVEGEINCQNAVIEGNFQGSINVKELLVIKENAKISGDVTTDKLIVNAGAIFDVNCNMGSKKTNKINTPPVSNKPTVNSNKEEKAAQIG